MARRDGGGLGRRGGGEDGRKIVANDGEVKAANSCFSLSAFVLLDVSTKKGGEKEIHSYRVVSGVRRNVGTKDLSFCVESFGKIDKNEKSSNFSL